jgi:hypothetical protein
MPEGPAIPRTFISYARADRPFAFKLAVDLTRAGLNVWYDQWEILPGDSIVDKIDSALHAHDVLLVVLSPDAIKSRWVRRELNSSLMAGLAGREVRVLPVMRSRCELPTLIADLHYADFTHSYDTGFAELLASFGLTRRVPAFTSRPRPVTELELDSADGAGGVAAIVVHGYSRTAHLSEVTVTVPQLSELRFVVTRDSKRVAWKLFVETMTRVSTQPLEQEEGLLREAMSSLYGLFEMVRETLKETLPSTADDGAPTVEQLAITMLNLELRPFLSRWHPALRRWEDAHPGVSESEWPENRACRDALTRTQAAIRDYALGYARLAGVRDARAMVSAGRLITPSATP